MRVCRAGGGHSYIIQYRYQVKGSDKFIVYFWQGRDSSITEKGAAAVETINVTDALGGDAPQLRVEQGKETRHFLQLFHRTGMVVHLGKQAGSPADAPMRLYQLRQAEHGGVRCVETDQPGATPAPDARARRLLSAPYWQGSSYGHGLCGQCAAGVGGGGDVANT